VLTLTPSHDLQVLVMGPGDELGGAPVAGAFVAVRHQHTTRHDDAVLTGAPGLSRLEAPRLTVRTNKDGWALFRDVEGHCNFSDAPDIKVVLDVLFVKSEPEFAEVTPVELEKGAVWIVEVPEFGSLLVEPVAPADGSGPVATRIELLPDRLLLGQRIPWPTAAVEHGVALFTCVGVGEQLIVRRADSPSFITVDAPSPSAHGEVARFKADFNPPRVRQSAPNPPRLDSQR